MACHVLTWREEQAYPKACTLCHTRHTRMVNVCFRWSSCFDMNGHVGTVDSHQTVLRGTQWTTEERMRWRVVRNGRNLAVQAHRHSCLWCDEPSKKNNLVSAAAHHRSCLCGVTSCAGTVLVDQSWVRNELGTDGCLSTIC